LLGRESDARKSARNAVEHAGAVAALAGGEEGSRVARLQSFFSTVLSGIFGQGEEEMATRNQNVAAAPQQQQNRGEHTDLVLWRVVLCWG
jgi:hypothetical protein